MTLYDSIILVYSLLYFFYFFRRGMPEELHILSLFLPLPFSSSLYHSLFYFFPLLQ